jgi:hypothetical protein
MHCRLNSKRLCVHPESETEINMKIMDIVDTVIETPLFEMAFQRKIIINRLRDFQFQINRHAMKIIVWPDAEEVPHWKRELTAWGNDLTAMTLRAGKRSRPMGFDLPWKHLYQEPFDPAPNEAMGLLARIVLEEYQRPVNKPLPEIVAELTTFLRAFCQAIGSQQTVGEIVNALGGKTAPTTRLPESASI